MEHFVKPSYGKMWHFCHNSQGICYSSISGKHTSSYEVLLPDGQPDFDVIIDNNDQIHLVCQNENGDIIYMKRAKDNWERETLMQSKSKENYKKNFAMILVGNWVNVLYSLQYKNSKIIAHQIIGNDGATPEVLDYIDGDFSVTKDKFNNIFVLYQSHTYGNFGYMAYVWSKKEWSDFVAVPVEGEVTNPHIFVDKSNVLHITGVLNGKIIYYSDTVQNFGEGANPVLMEKDNLYLLWENPSEGKIHAACSADNGKNFSNVTEFMAGRFTSAKIYAISYTAHETSCRTNRCYGYLTDGSVNFYLTPDFFNISRVPPKNIETKELVLPSEHKSDTKIILEELAKISAKLDNLQKSIDNQEEI
ncbi:MAG: hypothetical protein J6V58_02140 [Clostridia bacterium]|nr:hypothetical protein [Clostridia bacterium]